MSRLLLLLFVLVQIASIVLASSGEVADSNTTSKIVIFKAEFHHVATPYAVCAWVLAASLAKLGMNFVLFKSHLTDFQILIQ